MEFDPIEMMTFCIALFGHLGGLSESLVGLDAAAAMTAQSQLTEAIGLLVQDQTAIDSSIDAHRLMVADMAVEDMQEGAAFCLEIAEEL